MKYLDCAGLSQITESLDGTVYGLHRVQGQVVAYSCKLAGNDKNVLRTITQQAQNENLVCS